MKRLSKKIILLVMALGIMILPINTVKASLQSNPNTHYKKTDNISNWMVNMRNMEKTGEAMGLSETLNTDLTPSNDSNNIDVHAIKSTEYGAIAILSASGYGNPQILQASTVKTTTGNKTGIYFSGTDWELVAGGLCNIGANGRYWDAYTDSQTSAKVGDALGTATTTNPGCTGWHSASETGWPYRGVPFVRSGAGLFSFNMNYYSYGNPYFSRGVAVCGRGF